MSSERENSGFARVARGASVTFVGNVVVMALAFLTRVVSTKFLSPDGYGALVLGVAVLQVVERIGDLGIERGLARSLPRTDEKAAEFSTGLGIALVSVGVASSLLFVFSGPLAGILSGGQFVRILAFVALAAPASVLVKVAIGGLRGIEDAVGQAILLAGKQIAVFGCVAAALVSGYGPVGTMAGWALGTATVGVVAVGLVLKRSLVVNPTELVASMKTRGASLVRFSVPLMGVTAVWILMHQLDNILLGVLLEDADIGLYDVAYTLSRVLVLFLVPVELLFLPVFSDLDHNRRADRMRQLYRLTTKWLVVFTLPVLLVFTGFAATLLSGIFRPAFATATPAFVVLALGFFANVLLGPSQQALTAVGENHLVLRGALAALACNVLLNLLLIPRFGILGAAVATGVSYLLLNCLYVATLFRSLSIWPLTPRVAGTTIGGCVLFAGIYLLVRGIVSSSALALLAVALGFCLSFPVLFVVGGGVDAADVDLLRGLNTRSPVPLDRVVAFVNRHV